ncbi:MAG: DNA polymerase III subunit alpha [Bacteriovoracaceae bacterium]
MADTENKPSLLESHPDSFVHLHLHTQYSLLDGAIRLDDLFKKAKEFGMPAVAMSDHGNMFGAIDFYMKAKQYGVKPILGSEIYFTPGSRFDKRAPKNTKVLDSQDAEEGKHHIHHLVLLCKNMQGYRNLCQMLSKAYLEGFYYKPRIDVEVLRQFKDGLIATTACLKGEVGYNFFTDQDDKALGAIEKLHDIFGEDFYLEIQENGLPEQKIVNEKIIKLAKDKGYQVVATNDCHYLEQEDSAAQEVLLCVQTGKTFLDEQRMKLTTNEFYFKSPEKMRSNFSYFKDACDNTLRIAEKCNIEFKFKDDKGNQIYHLPDFPITTGESVNDYFNREAAEGLRDRFNGPHFKKLVQVPNWESEIKPQYEARLKDEVEMIIRMGFPGYFLIVSDFIRWSKRNDIPVGPGRGSGAGSLVAYSLSITNVDPIPYNLLFERFINPERVSMPDFDVDFCQDRRGEVIQYVTKKYGEERVGQIITFGKLQAKAVIRDVSRVFGLPYSEIDMLAKLIPDELGITLSEAIEKEPRLQELEKNDPKSRQILKISKRLEGLLRHASIHAAGVIITNEPLVNYCPLYRGKEGEQVVQFDKDFSEKIGLVKFDFLGLKTLTVIKNAEVLIRRDHDKNFDIEAIEMDDKNVFQLISDGNTTGVFQLESSGMKDLCKRIRPDSVDDITAINALYRPGPMGSGMHDEFVEIKHGRKAETYLFEELRPVLKDTYGIIVYQEQVMNISRVIAGYSLGQADMLRRAMGKKKADEMEKHKQIFVEGAVKRNFNKEKSEYLFDLMAKFAEYGFNKSHAVAYAVIAYQTAFLKHYYPAQFYAALLGSEMGNTDKVTAIINDLKENKLKILPPDINESLWSFNVTPDGHIRFGMGAIKNVGENAIHEVILEKEKNGYFKGFIDMCDRVSLKSINRRVMESLIKVGVFDESEKMNRKTLLDNLDLILAYTAKNQEEKALGQVNLFSFGEEEKTSAKEELNIQDVPDFDENDKLKIEAELMGIYVSGHPLDRFKDVMKQLSSMDIASVHELPKVEAEPQDWKNKREFDKSKREMMLSGMLTQIKPLLTKKGDRMAFAQLEDLTGKIEIIVFPKTYAEYSSALTPDEPVVLSGYVNLSEEPRKFFPMKISPLKEQAEERVTAVRISVGLNEINQYTLSKVKNVLLSYRGSVPAHMIFENEVGRARLPLGEEFLVNPTPQMAAKINEVFQKNSVKFIVDGKVEDVSV